MQDVRKPRAVAIARKIDKDRYVRLLGLSGFAFTVFALWALVGPLG